MIIIGLTGSMGMGKTTVARQFAEQGAKVFNADDTVRALYDDPRVITAIGEAFPEVVKGDAIDKERLLQEVTDHEKDLYKLESILHPYVRTEMEKFLELQKKSGTGLAVLDVPLLYEAGWDKLCDYVVVATAPYEVQKHRIMERTGMSEEKFKALLARQLPDGKKRKLADFIVETDDGLVASKEQVKGILERICGK